MFNFKKCSTKITMFMVFHTVNTHHPEYAQMMHIITSTLAVKTCLEWYKLYILVYGLTVAQTILQSSVFFRLLELKSAPLSHLKLLSTTIILACTYSTWIMLFYFLSKVQCACILCGLICCKNNQIVDCCSHYNNSSCEKFSIYPL